MVVGSPDPPAGYRSIVHGVAGGPPVVAQLRPPRERVGGIAPVAVGGIAEELEGAHAPVVDPAGPVARSVGAPGGIAQQHRVGHDVAVEVALELVDAMHGYDAQCSHPGCGLALGQEAAGDVSPSGDPVTRGAGVGEEDGGEGGWRGDEGGADEAAITREFVTDRGTTLGLIRIHGILDAPVVVVVADPAAVVDALVVAVADDVDQPVVLGGQRRLEVAPQQWDVKGLRGGDQVGIVVGREPLVEGEEVAEVGGELRPNQRLELNGRVVAEGRVAVGGPGAAKLTSLSNLVDAIFPAVPVVVPHRPRQEAVPLGEITAGLGPGDGLQGPAHLDAVVEHDAPDADLRFPVVVGAGIAPVGALPQGTPFRRAATG